MHHHPAGDRLTVEADVETRARDGYTRIGLSGAQSSDRHCAAVLICMPQLICCQYKLVSPNLMRCWQGCACLTNRGAHATTDAGSGRQQHLPCDLLHRPYVVLYFLIFMLAGCHVHQALLYLDIVKRSHVQLHAPPYHPCNGAARHRVACSLPASQAPCNRPACLFNTSGQWLHLFWQAGRR
jgi:hypothetical protein